MPLSSCVPQAYTGRFAPSPSGPLHAGSLVAAMASYLDARAHQGRWLLRIEDIDTPRIAAGADRVIMRQLQSLGMRWDADPVWQSQRHPLYKKAFDRLLARHRVYGCACTRREIDLALAGMRAGRSGQLVGASSAADAHTERPYPGTCRNGLPPGRRARAWRLRVPAGIERFDDRWQGPQEQDVEREAGDFALKRADGLWAYQFAVVIDDGDQGVTDIVRGADLLDSTARQRVLARMLDLPCPRVLHVPVVLDGQGRKLSKQNHAPALECGQPLAELDAAWTRLGFEATAAPSVSSFWVMAQQKWAARFRIGKPANP